MKRRNFVMSVLAGGAAMPALAAEHDHGAVSGPMANVTVTFGSFNADNSPPLDRFASTPNTSNVHTVLPFEAQIKAGGAVSFAISGFHILGVYGPGTEPEDINGSLVEAIPGAPSPAFPKVVNDPVNRVYRGLNPLTLGAASNDRVESVNFPTPGRYLVVCLFVPHFPGMHGYVNVLP